MNKSTVISSTRIARPPQVVYDFVTNPRNWVGTHPVTRAVHGDPGRPADVTDFWSETIEFGDSPAFEAVWTVAAAVPGRTWTMLTQEVSAPGMHAVIRYDFIGNDDTCEFVRAMTVGYEGNDALADRSVTEATPEVHDRYVERVRQVLEAES